MFQLWGPQRWHDVHACPVDQSGQPKLGRGQPTQHDGPSCRPGAHGIARERVPARTSKYIDGPQNHCTNIQHSGRLPPRRAKYLQLNNNATGLPYYLLAVSIAAAITALLWLAAPLLLQTELSHWELGVVMAVASWPPYAWLKRRARKQREALNKLRDSALW